MSLGTKFQRKLTIFIFWTKFFKKGMSSLYNFKIGLLRAFITLRCVTFVSFLEHFYGLRDRYYIKRFRTGGRQI